jgi:hypothetical protein
VTDTGLKFEIERLSGSDPTFEKEQVELDRLAKTNALAFWMSGARTMCRALPFFRIGAPQKPQETSFYVFNRVENGSFRWVSYQRQNHLSNRIFETYTDIVDACCAAWNAIVSEPKRIASIAIRDWASVSP